LSRTLPITLKGTSTTFTTAFTVVPAKPATVQLVERNSVKVTINIFIIYPI
tara:strand:+ start:1174 stop:1326 length:153 start_codon:yes stop_codon:yes gene_type:complete